MFKRAARLGTRLGGVGGLVMVSGLLMPRGQARQAEDGSRAVCGGVASTRILDWRHPRVLSAAQGIDAAARNEEGPAAEVAALRRAHRWISAAVRPVYSVEEMRPVSEVLRRGRGSCSQRMAVLEAIARSWDVPTRVRGLVVDGAFWYPRFPRLRRLVPSQVVLAWPEFRIGGRSGRASAAWLPVSELFAGVGEPGGRVGGGFTNAGTETLFDALARTDVDWDGTVACPASSGPCDLSAFVVNDLGHFDSRDELFARHGQTLCAMARVLADPVLSRREP
ncbi:transglutaminase domain-containing protein [Actinacidiphila bryophytorum]|uniref:transglutaminase domain-containing protein n=1 Tax=Actinacidiphila bryophytorum TaxID=1436133 RepID=UPI003969DFA8